MLTAIIPSSLKNFNLPHAQFLAGLIVLLVGCPGVGMAATSGDL